MPTSSSFPVRALAMLALLGVVGATLPACSAQARETNCRAEAERLRAKDDENILDPLAIRRLRSRGCLDVSAYG